MEAFPPRDTFATGLRFPEIAAAACTMGCFSEALAAPVAANKAQGCQPGFPRCWGLPACCPACGAPRDAQGKVRMDVRSCQHARSGSSALLLDYIWFIIEAT